MRFSEVFQSKYLIIFIAVLNPAGKIRSKLSQLHPRSFCVAGKHSWTNTDGHPPDQVLLWGWRRRHDWPAPLFLWTNREVSDLYAVVIMKLYNQISCFNRNLPSALKYLHFMEAWVLNENQCFKGKTMWHFIINVSDLLILRKIEISIKLNLSSKDFEGFFFVT